MYRAESQAGRERRNRVVPPRAAFNFDPSLEARRPLRGATLEHGSPVAPVGSTPPAGRSRAARQGFIHKGWATMSQVQTAEIAPADAKGDWAVVETEFDDRSILCVDCGQDFTWTAGEQLFFHDKGLKNEPKRCKPCKQAKNE